MMDKDGVIIYVGKARVLKNRVRQYFHSSPKPPKVQAMVENIADFSYVVTPARWTRSPSKIPSSRSISPNITSF